MTQVTRRFMPAGPVKEFFTTGVTPSAGPVTLGGAVSLGFRGRRGDKTARDLLREGVARLENEAVLKDRPAVRARLLHQLLSPRMRRPFLYIDVRNRLRRAFHHTCHNSRIRIEQLPVSLD